MYKERYSDLKKIGNDFMDQNFYLCYHKDGTKTYYKKLDPKLFQNKRYWVVSATSGFIASMELCWDVSGGSEGQGWFRNWSIDTRIFHEEIPPISYTTVYSIYTLNYVIWCD